MAAELRRWKEKLKQMNTMEETLLRGEPLDPITRKLFTIRDE